MLKRIASFLRPALVLLAVFVGFGFAIIAYQAVRTLQQLTVVEAERDLWQRPDDVIRALNLRQGSKVVDLGCGSGYFALKLSRVVNPGGTVFAVDIRRLPLRFLWVRTLISRQNNIPTVLGEPDNPHVPDSTFNAVLIANTYHELDNPGAILNQVRQSLLSGGRLVIVDPVQTERGEVSLSPVENQLQKHGFEIVSRESNFLNQPGRGLWWMIIARKP